MPKKKTHEEFLKELHEKNEHYRNGDFEIIGEYEATHRHILIKNKYGVLRSTPKHLLNNVLPCIQSAIDKTSYWINMAKEVHGDRFDYSKTFFINNSNKVKIKYKNSFFIQNPHDHIMGRLPKNIENKNRKTRVEYNSPISHEDFIKKLAKRSENFKNGVYQVVSKYINSKEHITIKIKDFYYSSSPENLLNDKLPTIQSCLNKSQLVKELLTNVHNGFYKYDKLEYVKDSSKVIITCPIHGDFTQKYNNHKNGKGCSKCAYNNKDNLSLSGFCRHVIKKTGWFYLIRCFNKKEEFFKIGLTTVGVKNRYECNKKLPYEREVLLKINTSEGVSIYNLEKTLKKSLKKFKYSPEIDFGGSKTECFKPTQEVYSIIRAEINNHF